MRVTENEVFLACGENIPFAYLAIATGSWQPSPSKLKSFDRDEACGELQQLQRSVEAAETIAVIGGGAVGIELAGDIASSRESAPMDVWTASTLRDCGGSLRRGCRSADRHRRMQRVSHGS